MEHAARRAVAAFGQLETVLKRIGPAPSARSEAARSVVFLPDSGGATAVSSNLWANSVGEPRFRSFRPGSTGDRNTERFSNLPLPAVFPASVFPAGPKPASAAGPFCFRDLRSAPASYAPLRPCMRLT